MHAVMFVYYISQACKCLERFVFSNDILSCIEDMLVFLAFSEFLSHGLGNLFRAHGVRLFVVRTVNFKSGLQRAGEVGPHRARAQLARPQTANCD